MRLFWSIAAASGILSVIAARIASAFLHSRIAIIGDFAGLDPSFNPGIAWGMRLPAGVQEAAIGVALMVVIYLAYRENGKWEIENGKWKMGNTKSFIIYHLPFSIIAYGMIVGGGVANIIDRIGDGVVTDFFQVGTFPVFNVADSFVTVGVCLLLWEALAREKQKADDPRAR